MADLVKNALYAVRPDDSELVYECLGQADMAHALGAIKFETLRNIEHALINGYLNAGGRAAQGIRQKNHRRRH